MATDQDKPGFRSLLRGVNAGVLTTGAIAVVANVAAVVELFGRASSVITTVLSAVTVVAGLLLLVRLWRAPLGGVTLLAVILIASGTLAFGWTVGRPAQPSADAAARAVSVKIESPVTGAVVPWKQVVRLWVGNLGPGQSLWLYVRTATGREVWPLTCRPVDPALFDCDGRFGHESQGAGRQWELTAVVLDQASHQTLKALVPTYSERGSGFQITEPPVKPVAQSPKVVVLREA